MTAHTMRQSKINREASGWFDFQSGSGDSPLQVSRVLIVMLWREHARFSAT